MLKRKFGLSALTLVTAASLAAGCSSGGNNNGENAGASNEAPSQTASASASASGSEELKPVELTWYYPLNQMQPDQQKVEDAFNKIVKEKINATVKLKPVAFGDYVQKMNTVMAAGENFDIMWTGYLVKPEELVRKGALQPLDDLLEQYAPSLKSDMPQYMWDGLTVDGKIYGIANQQINGSRYGFIIQKRFADKYQLDTASIKKLEDIEPFLDKIKQGEPDIIPFNGFYVPITHDDTFWGVPGLDDHFYIKSDDPTYQLLRYPEEELDTYRLMSKWYKAGYIYKDAATAKMNDYQAKGQIAVDFNNVLKPGVEAEVKAKNGGNDVIVVPISDWFTNGYSATTNQSISRTSKNPERAMMLLNLINSDPELYNLISNGIEGEHYTKTADGYITPAADSKYRPNVDWVFGNVFNSYLKEGQPKDVWEQTKKINETAELNPVGGFKFNSEPVVTEIANLNAVWGEYKKGLTTGTLDFDETWPGFYKKLKEAGEDKYVAEVQKQFDEYLKQAGLK
ncbi:ABC transporter substrate-binding protein [Cohnella thailandensis]|uniref:ABC transporter substrate-binding protein n=1 Tax=Cohnella thailandensis TaxID=557557 RepID=A0A841SR93_9BACL|nr:ABC transporter substrate-binding protein [Cohnella thailandensis]MBB6633126.1 ABC transporter substrate-binding protein [Cohnella thailandensis]MBP1975179.1 putative aldouronate transport system substrate-binding protein [Cohnella thailandensis]